MKEVAVIGAGLAGLVCARTLVDHGLRVTVFDKGRSPGGRATSRRGDRERGRGFDHGAQFFTARGEWLSRQVLAWEHDGVVARWSPRVSRATERPQRGRETWWVGTPRMGTLAAHLASGLDVRLGHTVSALARSKGEWSLTGAAADAAFTHHADTLVVAIPAAQCAALLASVSNLHGEVAAVEQTPCWAVMLVVRGAQEVEVDVFEDRNGVIAWAAREGSKPGRKLPEGEELWTLHASTEWSMAHLEESPESVSDALVQAFFDRHRGLAGTLVDARAHRWRYARGRAAGAQRDALFDGAAAVAVCGDWLAGERVEGALTSGLAAARLILGSQVEGRVL